MQDLTGFQRDLLCVVAGKDNPHGLAIKEELEQYYETEIHHGRLYPNLDMLVEKDFVITNDDGTSTAADTTRLARDLVSIRTEQLS